MKRDNEKRQLNTSQAKRRLNHAHKSLFKRITAVLITGMLMTTGMPMQGVSELMHSMSGIHFMNGVEAVLPDFEGWDGFHGILFSNDNSMKAEAAEPVEAERAAALITITTADELKKYAAGTGTFLDENTHENVTGYRHDDTIRIDLKTTINVDAGFVGIGTSAAPFSGIIINNKASTSDPYGDFNVAANNRFLNLNNCSLFNYVSTDAKIVDANGVVVPFLMRNSGDGTAPIFAKHIVAGAEENTPQTWRVVVNVNKEYGGIVGDIADNTVVNLEVGYLNNKDISVADHAGGICNSMSSGSTLNLWVKSTILSIKGVDTTSVALGNVSTTTADKCAGGLVGYMANNSTLNIKELPALTAPRNIHATGSSGYAGGLVGYVDQAYINFDAGVCYDDGAKGHSISGHGSSGGGGGIFGYYKVAGDGLELKLDSTNYVIGDSRPGGANSGGFIGKLELDSAVNTFTVDADNTLLTVYTSKKSDIINFGGIIGSYTAVNLAQTLTIKNTNTWILGGSKTPSVVGGVLGNLGDNSYVKVDGATVILDKCGGGSAVGSKNCGIVANAGSGVFIDIDGSIKVSTTNRSAATITAGLVGVSQSGVIRVAGHLDLSDAATLKSEGEGKGGGLDVGSVQAAILVHTRNNTLVYAMGNGTDYNATTKTGWTMIRPMSVLASSSSKFNEDIDDWGTQILRVMKDDNDNNVTLEDATYGALTYDASAHTITVKAPTIQEIENVDTIIFNGSLDYAKTALYMQLNNSENGYGSLLFEEPSLVATDLLSKNIKFTADVDMSDSGFLGLTRSGYDTNNLARYTYAGNIIDGGGYKLTLAIGQAYGYRIKWGETEVVEDDAHKALKTEVQSGVVHKETGALSLSLFYRLAPSSGNLEVKNLTIGGEVNAIVSRTEMYASTLSTYVDAGTYNFSNFNVTTSFKVANGNDKGSEYIGGIVSYIDKNATFSFDTCRIAPTIDYYLRGYNNVAKSNSACYCGGITGSVGNCDTTFTVDGMTIGTNVNAMDTGIQQYSGGLIGFFSNNDNKDRIVTLDNVEINGANIKCKTANGDNTTNFGFGFLGGSWHDAYVEVNGVTVSDGTIDLTNTDIVTDNRVNYYGGLVQRASGYWRVNDIDITGLTVEGGSANNRFGFLIGDCFTNNLARGLYFEMTAANAYFIAENAVTLTEANFAYIDEIAARNKKTEDNGQSIISIHTSGNKLNMTSGNGNEYVPQTTYAKVKANPNTRYYYNLDYLLSNANNLADDGSKGGAKFLLWSVYQYAMNPIKATSDKTALKIKENNDYNFDDYKGLNGKSTEIIDLSNLSYYPIDLSASLGLSNKTFKLNNKAMEDAHGTNMPLRNSNNSQHFMMHNALFKNISGQKTLTLNNCTLQGTAAEQNIDPLKGSGFLVCGTVSGTSATQKSGITLNGLILDGVSINGYDLYTGNPNSLLVRNVGDFTNINIKTVSTTNAYNDETAKTSAIAAQALLGICKGEGMTITFGDMRLDGRIEHGGNKYDTSFAEALDTAYNTYNSIFSSSTLIKTLQFDDTKGSTATYNYNHTEDWNTNGTALHHVTYGKEITNSAEFPYNAGNDDQTRYLDAHSSDASNKYTSYKSSAESYTVDLFKTGFRPYVNSSYSGTSTSGVVNHEISINHISIEINNGCGTYNDPFIIDDGSLLEVVAKSVSNVNFSSGFALYIDNDYLTSYDVNFEKWDSDKPNGTNHTRFESNGTQFFPTVWDATKEEWVADTKGTYKNYKPTFAQVAAYLSGAYFQLTGTEGNNNTITLSSNFIGLGAENSTYAFRGVVIGKSAVNNKNVAIVNNSQNPLIKVSNGAVIKDLSVTVGTDIAVNNNKGTNWGTPEYAFDYTVSSTARGVTYGGVIGKIMGGDNVIENVSISFGTNSINIYTNQSDGNNWRKLTQIVPVGGYVGTLVYGGLVFRNMSGIAPSVTVKDYKQNKTLVSTDCMSASDMVHPYCNPYVGRVINAYCFYETDAYMYTEETSTLKNSSKNYSIPDINASGAKITFDTVNAQSNINVPDGQALFMISQITQSMSGNAKTVTANYETQYSYGNNYKTTHIAQYSEVGTNENTSSDFTTFAKYDNIAKSDKTVSTPYIITHYTDGDSTSGYPARAITGTAGTKHYMTLTGSETYELPECFRGIGVMYILKSDAVANNNTMGLYGFNGGGNTINMRSEFKTLNCNWDPYFYGTTNSNTDMLGIALFNHMYMVTPTADATSEKDLTMHSKAVVTEPNNQFRDVIISGKVGMYQYGQTGEVENNGNGQQKAFAAGLIAITNYQPSNWTWFNLSNVKLKDLTVTGDSSVGGFFGSFTEYRYVYLNGCSTENLKLTTVQNYAGAIVGNGDLTGNGYAYVNNFSDAIDEFNVSVEIPSGHKQVYCGGLIGYSRMPYCTIQNVKITAPENGFIGYAEKTADSDSSNQLKAGGVVGRADTDSRRLTLKNVTVDGVNIYGYEAGGIAGNTANTTTFRTYDCKVTGSGSVIESYSCAGGLIGYSSATGNGTTVINGNTFSNHIDRCAVSGYSIICVGGDNEKGVGGLIGRNDANIYLANNMVENCTISCKGTSTSTGMGGIIGRMHNNTVSGYNLAVREINFTVTDSGTSTVSPYGLLCGTTANNKDIKIVGWSVGGDNKIAVTFGSYTGERDVEFTLGRLSSDSNLTAYFPSGYGGNSYIVPADYENKSLTESRGDALPTLTASKVHAVATDDNSPYATSSPKHTLGTEENFLTGDGISGTAVNEILKSYSEFGNAKNYRNITAVNSTAISKYNTIKSQFVTNETYFDGVPVLSISDTTEKKDEINAYLDILTNGDISRNKSSRDIKVYRCRMKDDGTIELSENADDLSVTKSLSNGKFNGFAARSGIYDKSTPGQFTLIDVQYKSPTGGTDIVYHLYVPIITQKLYHYDFKTTAFSGTQYYASKYTSDSNFGAVDPKVVVENYSTPVTEYLRWTYPTNTLISDVMNGDSGLDWYYKKSLDISVVYGGTIPTGSKFVLVDKNKGNKEYYYTVTGREVYSSGLLSLSFGSFEDNNGNSPTLATFKDMVNAQLTFTKKQNNTGMFIQDDEHGTMNIKIGEDSIKIRPATSSDTAANRFDIETTTAELNEDYYLTILVPDDGTLFHQFQVTSSSSLKTSTSGKINATGETMQPIQLNFANLFENHVSVTTLEDDGSRNVEMSDTNRGVNVRVVSEVQFKSNAYTSIVKGMLSGNRIPVYLSNHIYMNKRSTNNGVAEKMIAGMDNIIMTTNSNHVTAYSVYDSEHHENDAVISNPSALSYSAISGRGVTNFYEVYGMRTDGDELAYIDIQPYLTSNATATPTVIVESTFTINYTHSGVINQFPEREKSDETGDIGTYVSARSSLAYDSSDTTYSSNVSEIATDSANRLYYRYEMTDADLKFNVYLSESTEDAEEVSGDDITKANDQLGINIFDSSTDTHSVIQTKGIYDASQLSALEKSNLNIRWTIELQCKQDGYKADLKLLDYLNSITVKNVNEVQIAKLTPSDAVGTMETGGIKWHYSNARAQFEETGNEGLFDIYLDFDVKTGADLQAVQDAFYSNYKISLTATLCEGNSPIDGSSDDDYIIYTNARIDPTFVNMP